MNETTYGLRPDGKPRIRPKYRGIPQPVKQAVFARDNLTCQWCKQTGGRLVPHHRFRRSAGGRDVPLHMVSVHPLCHSYIHDHPREAQERGFLVRSEEALRHGWT